MRGVLGNVRPELFIQEKPRVESLNSAGRTKSVLCLLI